MHGKALRNANSQRLIFNRRTGTEVRCTLFFFYLNAFSFFLLFKKVRKILRFLREIKKDKYITSLFAQCAKTEMLVVLKCAENSEKTALSLTCAKNRNRIKWKLN